MNMSAESYDRSHTSPIALESWGSINRIINYLDNGDNRWRKLSCGAFITVSIEISKMKIKKKIRRRVLFVEWRTVTIDRELGFIVLCGTHIVSNKRTNITVGIEMFLTNGFVTIDLTAERNVNSEISSIFSLNIILDFLRKIFRLILINLSGIDLLWKKKKNK